MTSNFCSNFAILQLHVVICCDVTFQTRKGIKWAKRGEGRARTFALNPPHLLNLNVLIQEFKVF